MAGDRASVSGRLLRPAARVGGPRFAQPRLCHAPTEIPFARSRWLAAVCLAVLTQGCFFELAELAGGGGSGGGGSGGGGSGGAAGASPACVSGVARYDQHACALAAGGWLWCWGGSGLGFTDPPATRPELVSALGPGLQDGAPGYGHACAVRADGTVWCWGSNEFGQLGDGTTANYQPDPVEALNVLDAVSLAAGRFHTCALDDSQSLWCWGQNADGQLGDGSTTTRPAPVMIDGNEYLAVSAGGDHTCAISIGGLLYCWGSNSSGQVGDGTWGTGNNKKKLPAEVGGLPATAAQVSAGAAHTCAVLSGGAVYCWGSNSSKQLGPNATNSFEPSPVQVTGLGGSATGVAAGGGHSCAVLSDGTLWCWGTGYLGTGGTATIESAKPVQVPIDQVLAVAAGTLVTCAVRADGSLWCWGLNHAGQLGDGSTGNRLQPVEIMAPCP